MIVPEDTGFLELVYSDGSTPNVRRPHAQPFRLPQGVDVRIPFKVVRSNGGVQNIAGWSIAFTLKEDTDDAAETVGPRLAVITSTILGEGYFPIGPSDTVTAVAPILVPPSGPYVADIKATLPGPEVAELLPPTPVQLGPLVGEPGAVPTPAPASAGTIIAGALQVRTRGNANVLLTGLQAINGALLAAGDTVLLIGQTSGIDNGPWVVAAGAWSRPAAFANGLHGAGVLILSQQGASDPDSLWVCSTDAPGDVIGTHALAFKELSQDPSVGATDLHPHVIAAGAFNIAIPAGLITIDGIALADGDRVLVTSNSLAATKVGIYVARAGNWERPADYDIGDPAAGALVYATKGTTGADQLFRVTTDAPLDVIDIDPIAWTPFVMGVIEGGFTKFRDAATLTGIEFSAFLTDLFHYGILTMAVRGESDGINCALFPARDNSYLGLLAPSPTFFRAFTAVTAKQYATVQKDIAFSATPAFDPNLGTYQSITLTGNITSWTVAAQAAAIFYGFTPEGCTVTIAFIQDGVGGRTLAGTPANVRLSGGALVLSAAPGAADLITFRWDKNLAKWLEQSRSLNV